MPQPTNGTPALASDPAPAPSRSAARLVPPPSRFGRILYTRPILVRAAVVLAFALGAVYFSWRILFTFEGANPVMFVAFLVAELIAWVNLVLYGFQTWTLRASARTALETRPTVDVFVCTYDEPVDLLRATLTGARACARRYGPAKVWLLDDGRRRAMKSLARQLGVGYLTRPDNRHAKAGNINAALAQTEAELVFVLDADHVPAADALEVLAAYHTDPQLAFVQTPHAFYNADSVQHFDRVRSDQSLFFHVVCPGKDHHGAAFWCGSGALLRRTALDDIGGVLTATVAEDYHTSIAMHAKGWKSAYHDEILVRGLAPLDLVGYLTQRERWARGNVAVLRTRESPLRIRGLSWRQRLCYLASLLSYAVGPQRLLMLGVLIVALWSGALPLHATSVELALIWAPAVAATILAGSMLGRGWSKFPASTRQELITSGVFTRAWLSLRGRKESAFKVTPKDGEVLQGFRVLFLVRELVVLALLLAFGVALRVPDLVGVHLLPSIHGLALPLLVVLGAWEAFWTFVAIDKLVRRRQRRSRWRFACRLDARFEDHDAIVIDLHPDGFGVDLPSAVPVESFLAIDVALPAVDGASPVRRFVGQVRSCRKQGRWWRVGVEAVFEPDVRQAVFDYCFVVANTDSGATVTLQSDASAAAERVAS